jgi:integrase
MKRATPRLRASFARPDLKLAQMLAGHADIGTTANTYAHLDTSDLETALKALNEAET